MNYVGSIQIHGNTAIKARAERNSEYAWLTLEISQVPFSSITFHMPFDRADILADAINKGEAEWADLCASEQEADEKINGTVASDNRLGAFELGVGGR